MLKMSQEIVHNTLGKSPLLEAQPSTIKAVSTSSSDVTGYVFVSSSLGEKTLRRVFKEASSTGAIVLFRGIPKGSSLAKTLRDWHRLMANLDPIPQVRIDPKAFVHWQVTSVPAIFQVKEQKVIASALGVYSQDWLQEQIDKGNVGNLGQRGPIQSISEPDLIDEAMARLKAIDFAHLKLQAKARFWSRQSFIDLPKATQYQSRLVDPTFVLSRPLFGADGQVLIPVGTRFNPLKILPFTQTLVVFNARHQDEVDAIIQWLFKQDRTQKRITFITTQIDTVKGWQHLTALENALNRPIYLLNASLQQRFALFATPSFVNAKGGVFEVKAIPPKELNREISP